MKLVQCSRPGAAARRCGRHKIAAAGARREFAQRVGARQGGGAAVFSRSRPVRKVVAAFEPELDILVFVPRGVRWKRLKSDGFDTAARNGLHLAVAELPLKFWADW